LTKKLVAQYSSQYSWFWRRA